MRDAPRRRSCGFTLLEILIALAISAVLLAAFGGIVGQSLDTWAVTRERNALTQEARFAMDRMVTAVQGTQRLLLPLAENPATPHSEAVRDVLAVALDPSLDRDADGFADADNDRDGKADEDPPGDVTKDGKHGIVGIDDDGDGSVDEGGPSTDGTYADDDEDGVLDEDPVNGVDDDGDGIVDEDPGGDWNGDSEAGVAGFDDDADGATDEGSQTDDDEDGANNEDGLDPVVYFLGGTKLIERLPNLDPSDGTDFTERVIAENVTRFRVERIPPGPGDRAVLVEISLELSGSRAETAALTSRVRVGGGR